MSLHFANYKKSKRLQRVLGVLSDRQPHSTRDIMIYGSVCAVNSCISELRGNGFDIICQRKGKDRFEYRLRN